MTTSLIDLPKTPLGSLASGRFAPCAPRRSSQRLAHKPRHILAYAVDQPQNGATLEKETAVKTVSSLSVSLSRGRLTTLLAFGGVIRWGPRRAFEFQTSDACLNLESTARSTVLLHLRERARC